MAWIFSLIILCIYAANSFAIDVDCGNPVTLQAAINNAGNGSTLSCTTGGTWNSSVSIPGTKGITLDGRGFQINRGSTSSALITINTNPTSPTRVTNINLSETTAATLLIISGGFSNAKFRVDHSSFYTTAGSAILVKVNNSWGLIDHCTLTGDSASEMIHNEAWGAGNDTGWTEDITPGSGDALYVEDCTFNKYNQNDQYFWGTSALQSYYGARTVVRYNTFNYCQIDQHGTLGMIGARWWEIYENTFHIPAAGGNQSTYMSIRAGSGVIFNNHKTGGVNGGSGGIELVEEDSGYPALYQIGRGKNQISDPAYVWGNDAGMTVGSGSSNVQVSRDYYTAAKPVYVPYTYPHPLINPTLLKMPLPTKILGIQ